MSQQKQIVKIDGVVRVTNWDCIYYFRQRVHCAGFNFEFYWKSFFESVKVEKKNVLLALYPITLHSITAISRRPSEYTKYFWKTLTNPYVKYVDNIFDSMTLLKLMVDFIGKQLCILDINCLEQSMQDSVKDSKTVFGLF